MLARAADVALDPASRRRGWLVRSPPTTSTLIELAIGDALAIATLERRGFTINDFRRLHPGGSLGVRLTRVRDVMRTGDGLPSCGRAR